MKTLDLQALADKIIAASPADQTQVSISTVKQAFSRFNENRIHQNLIRNLVSVSIKVVVQKRIGSITVNDVTSWEKIQSALEQALEIAKMQPPNKDFVSLPKMQPENITASVDSALANFSPMDRAEVIGKVIDFAKAKNLVASGTFSIETGQQLVANSLGLKVSTPYAHGFFRTIMSNGNCTGYADQVINSIKTFTPSQLAETAAEKALVCNDPNRIQPGKYTVLLEPIAVADLLRFLGIYTFNGQAVQEQRSYLSKHMGQQIVDPRLTIIDDTNHPQSPLLPFDAEGVPRKRVPLIEKGIAVGAVYDTATAYKYDLEPTGHAGRYGSMPAFMSIKAGNMSREEMIKSIDQGIIINRFHYTHCPGPMKAIATGTSRDGTLWIENGKIARRINNVRFTQSIIEAFNNIIDIGDSPRPTRDWWSSFISLVPALTIKDFNITGTTTF